MEAQNTKVSPAKAKEIHDVIRSAEENPFALASLIVKLDEQKTQLEQQIAGQKQVHEQEMTELKEKCKKEILERVLINVEETRKHTQIREQLEEENKILKESQLLEEIASLKAELEDANEKTEHLAAALEDAQRRDHRPDLTLRLQKMLFNTQADLQESVDSASGLRAEIKTLKEGKDAATRELADMRKQNQELQTSLTQAKKDTEAASDKAHCLEIQNNDMAKKFDGLKQRGLELQRKCTQMAEEVTKSQSSTSEDIQTNPKLEGENARLWAEIAKLQGLTQYKNAEIEGLKKHSAAYKQELESIKNVPSSKPNTITRSSGYLHDKISILQNEKCALEKENSRLRNQSDNQQIVGLHGNICYLQDQVKHWIGQYRCSQEQIRWYQADVAALNQQLQNSLWEKDQVVKQKTKAVQELAAAVEEARNLRNISRRQRSMSMSMSLYGDRPGAKSERIAYLEASEAKLKAVVVQLATALETGDSDVATTARAAAEYTTDVQDAEVKSLMKLKASLQEISMERDDLLAEVLYVTGKMRRQHAQIKDFQDQTNKLCVRIDHQETKLDAQQQELSKRESEMKTFREQALGQRDRIKDLESKIKDQINKIRTQENRIKTQESEAKSRVAAAQAELLGQMNKISAEVTKAKKMISDSESDKFGGA